MANGSTPTIKAVAGLSGLLGTALGVLIQQVTVMTDLATLSERVVALQSQISQGVDDRYRGADARRDFALVDQQIQQNAKQIEELHELLRAHISSRQEHPR